MTAFSVDISHLIRLRTESHDAAWTSFFGLLLALLKRGFPEVEYTIDAGERQLLRSSFAVLKVREERKNGGDFKYVFLLLMYRGVHLVEGNLLLTLQ